MILYFSGTGNSEYVAKYLGDKLNDSVINLGNYLKKNELLNINCEKPYVLVSPVYVSVLPLEIEDFITKSTLLGNKNFYLIMTCAGSGISASAISGERICKAKGFKFKGVSHLSMPQNYLMYFTVASKEESKAKFEKAISNLPSILEVISNNKEFAMHRPGLTHKMLASRPMIKLFDLMLIGTKKFNVNEQCIGCGLCEKLCPKNVIKLVDGKPIWNKKGCLHCTACINKCPKQAINYGTKTITKNRYVAQKYNSNKEN